MAFIAKLGEQSYTVEIEENGKSVYRVSVDGNEFLVDGKKTGRTNFSLIVDNRSFEIEVDNTDDEYRVLVDGRNYRIHLVDERRAAFRACVRQRAQLRIVGVSPQDADSHRRFADKHGLKFTLLSDPDLAWRAYATSLLAEALAETSDD